MGRRTKENSIDWELVEKEYRLGQFSLRRIAAQFDIQPSAISRKAKKEGWVQDKSEQVKILSDNQLILSNTHKATEKATPTKAEIEEAATARTNKVLDHRADILRSRNLLMLLIGELEITTGNLDLFEKLGELMYTIEGESTEAQQAAQAKRIEVFNRIISTSSRIDSFKKAVDTLEKLVNLEGKVWRLEYESKQDPSSQDNTHSFEGTDKEWDEFQSAIKH